MLSTGIARSVASLLVGTLFIAAVQAAPATTSSAGEEVRSLNGEALRLQSEARRAKTTTLDGRAAKSFERRQKSMQELIERDPTTAAAIALPGKVLKQLGETFPAQKSRLEQRGSWDGELEFLIEDGADLKSHRNVYRLHRGAETLDLRFAGREPPRLKSGQKLTVKGVRALQAVAATEVEVLDAFLGGSAATAASTGRKCAGAVRADRTTVGPDRAREPAWLQAPGSRHRGLHAWRAASAIPRRRRRATPTGAWTASGRRPRTAAPGWTRAAR